MMIGERTTVNGEQTTVDMVENKPRVRMDLEFVPIRQGNDTIILIRDPLGLVDEGKAVPLPLYRVMALLDGTRTVRDIQMDLMRLRGGMLVGSDEVDRILAHLDDSFLLDSSRYGKAAEGIVAEFTSKTVRPCSHSGRSYPGDPGELAEKLGEILALGPAPPEGEERLTGLIAPHIDLGVGAGVYASAYRMLEKSRPARVVILGVGHQIREHLFCLTEKDFETPFGVVKNDRIAVEALRDAGGQILCENDFYHRAEHSIEFQVIFLSHLLRGRGFSIVPVLCGPFGPCLGEYTRAAYLEKAGPILRVLSDILGDGGEETLLVAGVDFSHIGPKFGHEMPASYLQRQTEAHDRKLLEAVSGGDREGFWAESIRVRDQFNVCGFSAMACLMETLPPSRGRILDYRMWHEEPTRSAVSFAAVRFYAQ